MHARSIICAAVGAAALAVAPGAMASTVTSKGECVSDGGGEGVDTCNETFSFKAAPGETNALTISKDASGRVVFTDAGAPITAGRGCRQIGPSQASCTEPTDGTVALGDRDDTAVDTRGGSGVEVDGGSGADRLTAAGDADRLGVNFDGGSGDDVLRGGAGIDSLTGDGGRDDLSGLGSRDRLIGDGGGAAPAADKLDGGEDIDEVDYSDRRAAVTVVLGAPGTGGAAGEGDVLTGIENVNGGRGKNRLTGDAGPNILTAIRSKGSAVLTGNGGDDRLVGGDGGDRLTGDAGADTLIGADGRDRLSGGDGDDTLDPADVAPARAARGDRDIVDCGAGSDMTSPHRTVLIPASCERIGIAGPELGPATAAGPRSVALAVFAPRTGGTQACAGVLTLRGPDRRVRRGGRTTTRVGRALGETRVRFPKAGTRQATIRLNRRGRKALARRGPLRAVMAVRTYSRCGKAARRSQQYRFAYRLEL